MNNFSRFDSVSVVIPVFNSGATALISIRSVLNQSHVCSEIIVIDDGSSDNSYELISSEFSAVNGFRIFRIKNVGAAGARNYGISVATSNFVAFLDSDDIWIPEKIEKQLKFILADSSVSMIGALTNIKNFNAHGFLNKQSFKVVGIDDLLFKNYFQTSTVLVLKDVVNFFGGFPVGRRYAEEGDLFMKIAARYKCVLLNEIMVDYAGGKHGFGTAGLSANLWRMELGELNNIIGVWMRGDIGLFVTGAALTFSLLKFFRRVTLRLSWRLSRSLWL